MPPSVIWEIFNRRETNYKLSNFAQLLVKVYIKNRKHIILGPKIWRIVSNEMKQLASYNSFEKSVRNENLVIALVDYVKIRSECRFLVTFSIFVQVLTFESKKELLRNEN